MSYKALIEALTLAKQCAGYTVAGERTEEEIACAENSLGIVFSRQHREYLRRVGGLSLYGIDVFGIYPSNTAGILEGDTVAYTLNERRSYDLPLKWIALISLDEGYMGFLDYGNLNNNGEPPVIVARVVEDKYVFNMVENEDLGDFLLRIVEIRMKLQDGLATQNLI